MDVKSKVNFQKNVENKSRGHELKLQNIMCMCLLDVF